MNTWLPVGLWLIGILACAPPPRSSFARYPGAPAERDASQSDPRALAIADRVFAAAGGAHWNAARELRWTQIGAATVSPMPRPDRNVADTGHVIDSAATNTQQHYWDRWNGRYALRWQVGVDHDAFAFDIYGSDTQITTRHDDPAKRLDRRVAVPMSVVAEGNGGWQANWHPSTALVWLPFLLREPGAVLAYLGPVSDERGESQRIRLSFPADPRRSAAALELTIGAADTIRRVSITTSPHRGATYELADWITVAGLAVPTRRIDLATGEVTQIRDITVRATVDNDDFVWPD